MFLIALLATDATSVCADCTLEVTFNRSSEDPLVSLEIVSTDGIATSIR